MGSTLNEFSMIKTFFSRHAASESVEHGVGDDCAVLIPPPGQRLVVSIDTQVSGRHFPADTPADKIASRALHCAVSDLAAMGAEPLWFTLALTLPHADSAWLELFSKGLYKAADVYPIALVGGDTTSGHLSISIQVHGAVPEKSVLLRSGAKVGDQIFVTGSLGDAAAGLKLVQNELTTDEQSAKHLRSRFYDPEARIRAGLLLRYMASACIDISDGLLADLKHICEASGVGAELDATKVPLSAAILASVPTGKALELALTGGDDYQLCFTAAPEHAEQLYAQSRNRALDVTRIGEIVAGSSIVDIHTGQSYSYKNTGFSHF